MKSQSTPSTSINYARTKEIITDDDIIAYEATLCERSSFTGILRSPGAHMVDDHFGAVPQGFLEKRKKPALRRNVSRIETEPRFRRFKPASIALLMSAIIAVGVVTYASLRSLPEENSVKTRAAGPVVKEETPNFSLKKIAVKTQPLPSKTVTNEALAEYEALLKKTKEGGSKAKRIGLLREAIEIYPKGDQAKARLSIMLTEPKKTRAEAFELARSAVEINPDNAVAWLSIGYVHQLEGRRAETKQAYDRCSKCSGPKRYVNECRMLR